MADLRVVVLDEALAAKALKVLEAAEIPVLAQGPVSREQDVLAAVASLVEGLSEQPKVEPSSGMAVGLMEESIAPVSQSIAPWRRALAELGGSLRIGERAPLPPALAKSAPVLEVLNSAGEQGVVDFGGEQYGAYGWPDLRRNNAKVLLVGQGEPYGEVIAVHRLPGRHGVCRRGGGLLPSTGRMGRTAMEVTNADYPDSGRLFAVDRDCIWVLEGQQVQRWDGRRKSPQGSPSACMASLLLNWSQK